MLSQLSVLPGGPLRGNAIPDEDGEVAQPAMARQTIAATAWLRYVRKMADGFSRARITVKASAARMRRAIRR